MNNNDFWLNLSRTADAFNEGGLTTQERMSAVMGQFEQMPHLAKREILSALRSLAYQLPDLHTVASARSLELRMEAPGRSDRRAEAS
jgi:hypothetical protein